MIAKKNLDPIKTSMFKAGCNEVPNRKIPNY